MSTPSSARTSRASTGLGRLLRRWSVAVLGAALGGLPLLPAAEHLSAQTRASDPVAPLLADLQAGRTTLARDSLTGWLPGLLHALDVPVQSQMLVFSRTSLQTDRIGPWAPRAVYFNDDVYVGYVQDGGLIEIASVDPEGGIAFYSLSQVDADTPRMVQEDVACVMCHESRSLTGGVPGLIVRSVLTDRLGYPIGAVHPGNTTLRTPVEKRWGGWYVTGPAPAAPHAGNVHASDLRHEVPDVSRYVGAFDFSSTSALHDVSGRVDPEPYLTPYSDPVALAVLTHQVEVHNLISQAREAAREAGRQSELFDDEALAGAVADDLRPAARIRVDGAVDRLLKAMLFSGERFVRHPEPGPSGFVEMFEGLGPRDRAGRSLRDFDLQDRLFRYPLTFLIYTEAFDALPPVVDERLRARLTEILNGSDDPDYAHLTAETRAALQEILAETKPELLGG